MKKSKMLIETEITDTLLSAGLPANQQGFQFLKDAIYNTLKTPSLIHQLTKKLYPDVGKKFGVSSAIVERSMRHTIEAGFKTGGVYNINYMLNAQYFGEHDKPCNGCFIALAVEIVKKNLYKLIADLENSDDPENNKVIQEIEDTIGTYSDVIA